MNHKKKVVDNMIQEYFGNIRDYIKKEQASVEQKFVSKGMHSSSVCTNAILSVYYQAFDSKLEAMISFIRNDCIRPDWKYLSLKVREEAEKLYENAEAAGVAHATRAMASPASSFQVVVNRKKEEVVKEIKNKLELLEYSIDEKQSLNDRLISFIKHNPAFVWIWAIVVSVISLMSFLSLLSDIISF